MEIPQRQEYSPLRRLAAWGVHLFTASGLLAGFMALLAAIEQDWRTAMLWLLACQIIDGVDGLMARAVRVKEVLPYMNGQNIDYVIDFFTYAIVPAYIFFAAIPLPSAASYAGAFIMLLTAAIYYGKEGMVAEDEAHFVGFPVMWNMVVYMQVFVFTGWSGWVHLGLVVVFAVLHFLPIYFAYPSRDKSSYLPWVCTILFLAGLLVNVWVYPAVSVLGRLLAIAGTVGFAALATRATWQKFS